MEPEINEEDLRSAFYGYGEIRSIKIIPLKRIAFVEYVEVSVSGMKAWDGLAVGSRQVSTPSAAS